VNPSSKQLFPWRLFWLLLVMAVLGALSIVPLVSDLIASLATRIEPPNISLPLIVVISAVQNLALLALMIGVGLKLAPRLGLRVPLLESLTRGAVETTGLGRKLAWSLLTGVAVGAVLLIVLLMLVPRLPNLPLVFAARLPIWKRFLMCFYGGICEEVLTRLFLLTLVAWIANRSWQKSRAGLSNSAFWFANIFAAILFGLGHLPSASLFMQITPLVVIAALVLNGIAGVAFGYLYRRNGLESAMVAHFTADFVIYVVGAALL
jgi:membrane protease YdiL (CAAX protease family)